MLDIKLIREEPESVKRAVLLKKEQANINAILELDLQRRTTIQRVEELKKLRNENSKQVSIFKKEGKNVDELIQKTKTISSDIKTMDEELGQLEQEIAQLMDQIPNIPHEDVPEGNDSDDNVEVDSQFDIPVFDFKILNHIEIGERLDILDFPRGGKVTGSGFPVYKGDGARLERALINFMLDLHTEKHGYTEIFTPFMANKQSMYGTGQIPKLKDDMYYVEKDDLYLIPTSEVTITNMFRDEILTDDQLPIKFAAYSACFRREAGSYGKDTRGFLRVHQFNKVELVNFVKPQDSETAHKNMLKEACTVLNLLEIPYRVMLLCTGDLSFAAAKCYDIETWSPAENKWLEASSVSVFDDFQARRANIRYRNKETKKVEYVHTLNGSGLATSRLMVSILENYQTDEGTVMIPELLLPYMNGKRVIKR
jgi:seryl-tRNA synthetase